MDEKVCNNCGVSIQKLETVWEDDKPREPQGRERLSGVLYYIQERVGKKSRGQVFRRGLNNR